MKEYSHGVPIEIGRRPRRNRTVVRHANAIFAAIIVSVVVIGAVAVCISSPPDRQEEQKARINWTTDVVDSNGNVGQYCSLAFDPAGVSPVIVYYNATPGDLKYAFWAGSNWVNGTSYSFGDVGQYASNVRSSSGVMYVCFYDVTNSSLLYGNSLGHAGVVDSVGDVGQFADIAVNSVTGTLAISYYDALNGDLKVAVNVSGSGWVNKTVDAPGDVGYFSNMAFLGTNDTMSVLYYDATNQALKNAWQWGGAGPWYNMTIDSDPPLGDLGKWPSQFTSGNDWWGAYYDQGNGNLKVQSFIYSSGTVVTAVPDSIGYVGGYTSISVNSTGHVFISYYDFTNQDLKLAWNESTTWYNMTLDSTGNVGLYTSLAIDPSDAIHICYYDATNGDLKYVKVLASEIVIPEFGDVVVPIVGTIAIISVLAVRRERKAE